MYTTEGDPAAGYPPWNAYGWYIRISMKHGRYNIITNIILFDKLQTA